jgi:hypothetical protein
MVGPVVPVRGSNVTARRFARCAHRDQNADEVLKHHSSAAVASSHGSAHGAPEGQHIEERPGSLQHQGERLSERLTLTSPFALQRLFARVMYR